MSTIEVDKIQPQSGTNLQIGEAGDSLTFQNNVIPNTALANGSITINGVSVNLGGSATIPTETQPVISSFTPTVIDADVGGTITITGQNFASIPKVELQRANGAFQSATSVTFTSATTISFTTGTAGLTNGQNVRILVTNPDGNAARSSSDLVVSDGPVFTTTSLTKWFSRNILFTKYRCYWRQCCNYFTISCIWIFTSRNNYWNNIKSSRINIQSSNIRNFTKHLLVKHTYSFTVRATDAQGQTTDQALSITVELLVYNNAGGFC